LFFIIVTFTHEGLNLWLGSEFADNSTLVLQLLAVGVFINSHAYIPSGLIQGAGRPDLNAKLHLIELPFYLLSLWWLVGVYGIVGAAIAWVLRVLIDAIILFVMARRLLTSAYTLRPVFMFGTALFVLTLGAIIQGLVTRGVFITVAMFLFAIVAWLVILSTEERNMIRKRLHAMLSFN